MGSKGPQATLYRRIAKRMNELERDLAQARDQLAQHAATMPQTSTSEIGLLEHLPHQVVDLNYLAVDRLRRFLDAFNIEIHFDHTTRRATVKASISGDILDEVARLASQVAVTLPQPHTYGSAITSANVPAQRTGTTRSIGTVLSGAPGRIHP